MILNSKNNNFIFRYPKDFLPDNLKQKYNTYLKTQPTPFKNCIEYLNATIQKVTLPILNITNIEQGQTQTPYKRMDRGGLSYTQNLTREISVTHKHTEGFISYFMIWENIINYDTYQNDRKFLPPVDIVMLNNEFKETFRYKFDKLLFSGFGETIDLDYSSVRNIPKTFTIKYQYNSLETILNLDGNPISYSGINPTSLLQ